MPLVEPPTQEPARRCRLGALLRGEPGLGRRSPLSLALELREHNIQVNCIAPVFVATDAVKRFYASEVQSHAALEPVDVAELAMFLLSSGADHISGQVIATSAEDRAT